MRSCFVNRLAASVAVLCAAVWTAPLAAAPPKLTGFFPAGGQIGQKVAVTASGEFAKWPAEFHADRPGLTIVPAADKGKLDVQIAADALPGVYWLRAVDAEGASSPKAFLVDRVTELAEVEPNDAVEKGQTVELPTIVNGKVGKAGDVDGYLVSLKAGQSLTAALAAHAPLGSPMDAVLQIAELVGGGEPPSGTARYKFPRRAEAYVLEHCDDETGLDPQLTFVAPRDGRYLVRVFAFPSEPNSTIGYAGGDNYIYRLTLTAGPRVDIPLPLSRSTAAPAGPVYYLDGRAGSVPRPADLSPLNAAEESFAADDRSWSWVQHAEAVNAAAIPWTSLPSLIAGPESLTAAGQELAGPAVVSGLLPQPNAKALFRIPATKGQKWRLRVDSRSLGFPLDPHVSVVDAQGKQLAENDDSGKDRDALLTYAASADGPLRVVVRDVHHHGGPRYAYRLTAELLTPEPAVAVAADAFVLTAGKPLEIPVTIERRDGFAEALEVSLEGLPAGVTAAPATSAATGDTAKAVKLVLNADPAATTAVLQAPLRIAFASKGDAAKNIPPFKRYVTFAVPGAPQLHSQYWLTVVPAAK
ncbi:MAG: hypothetical protein U0939_07345 [Pirellulales bacterium]